MVVKCVLPTTVPSAHVMVDCGNKGMFLGISSSLCVLASSAVLLALLSKLLSLVICIPSGLYLLVSPAFMLVSF